MYGPLFALGRFLSVIFLFTVGRTPRTGDQPIARPLPTNNSVALVRERPVPTERPPLVGEVSAMMMMIIIIIIIQFFNSIQFFIIYVPSQQLQGQLQTQHSANTIIIIIIVIIVQ
jgi:hypothetical protein